MDETRVELLDDGIAVLSPGGDMDITRLPVLEARVAALFEDGTQAIVWDLDRVGILPSTAAGFLLQTLRRVRDRGGRMVLASGGGRVLGTLRTMGVLELFRVYPTRDEALAAVRTP